MADAVTSDAGVNNSNEASALREKAAAAKAAVADLASEAKKVAFSRLGEFKDNTVEWAGEKKDYIKEKASSASENIVGFVEENPYKAIAIAVGIGVVIGMLLKRR